MSTTGIERPIELAPERVRQLLTARHGELELPMTPQPMPPTTRPSQAARLPCSTSNQS